MGYFGEFRSNWRAIFAAFVGMAFGHALNNYLNNLFIPALMQEFAWPRAQVSLIGLPTLLSVMCQPLAGRLVDRFGVRAVASCGVILTPVFYLAMSRMGGTFAEFFVLNVLHITLVTSTTGAVVYSRLVAQSFERARGLAFALIASAPSLAGAAAAPALTTYIGLEGWRAGFMLIALVTGMAGAAALLFIPVSETAHGKVRQPLFGSRQDYRAIVRNPAFRPILAGMSLCSLSVVVQASQLKLIIEDLGVASERASWMISLYAGGVILGRFACGAALDRFAAHVVAAVALGLPGIGLGLLAAGSHSPLVLALAVLLLGLSLGSELDVAGYLIMKFFPLEVYSTVLGIMIGAIAVSGALGSLMLSLSLEIGDSYSLFLSVSALCAIAGGSLFLRLAGAADAKSN